MAESFSRQSGLREQDASDLKRRTIRGGMASGAAQAAAFILRTGSMVVMSRLLFPKDFGLFGMVLAFTGFLSLFRDFGLSMASVTRVTVTKDQLSTLFWLNIAVGMVLAALCAAAGPILVRFYSEPRLLAIAVAVGTGFLFLGAGAQHRAMLQRAMHFGTLAIIDTAALLAGIIGGIATAASGFGYWALVVMTVTPQVATTVGTWLATGWIPGLPKRGAGVRSMLWYGGGVTFNGVIVYIAYNVDKILLGRYWGADALGIYGRAYQLINLPTDNLTSTVSQVVFPALARLQNDPARLRSYFVQGYRFFFGIVLPLTVGCAIFSEDIVHVFLGARWLDAAPVFRLLSPTMMTFALINPLGWMLMATDRIARSVKMAIVIAPTVMIAYTIGLPFGPQGVATGFSGAMLLLAVPLVMWATHRTPVTLGDVARAVGPALLAITIAAITVLGTSRYTGAVHSPFLRLLIRTTVLFSVYMIVLLGPLGQMTTYRKILTEFTRRTPLIPTSLPDKAPVSAAAGN